MSGSEPVPIGSAGAESGRTSCLARRHWVRARSRATGQQVASVVVRHDRPEIIVLEPLTALLRVTPNEAVAVALCLRVAVQGFAHTSDDDLVMEIESGDGWKPALLQT